MTIFARPFLTALVVSLGALFTSLPAHAFCGFYVAKADAKLFNKASKAVLARRAERTAVTMASDYEGDLKEFALVIPVPTVVSKDQIRIVESAWVDHLDAYSAPRLVEYHDPDPCNADIAYLAAARQSAATMPAAAPANRPKANALGVKIEAEYTVGEYDILILSATQSNGLATWLDESGYKIPPGAAPVLGSYIKQGMKFFVARVNLAEQAKTGRRFLRPIQVNYTTHKFMLPIRLGTVNANGPQDMIMLMLTEKGRVETTNYRTIKMPSNMDVPIFTRKDFGGFYRAVFDHQVAKDDMRAVYLEYAWDMGWCDPCAADPVPNEQLVALGAFWLDRASGQTPAFRSGPIGSNVFITRLHVRYDAVHFPEDLVFQETADRSNFQGRYVLRHPFTGAPTCAAGQAYLQSLASRFEREAETLSQLTGWEMAAIKTRMQASGQTVK